MTEIEVTLRLALASKFADRGCGALHIGMQIEYAARAPRMSCEDIRALEIEVILETLAAVAEQLRKYLVHREYRRARVDLLTVHADAAQFPSGCRGALEHGDVATLAGEIGCGGKATHPCADDDDAMHGPVQPRAGARRATAA